MDPHDLFLRSSHKPKRIGLPQISLPCKRKFLKILLRLDLVHIDAFQFLFVKAFFAGQFLKLFLDKKEL